MTDLQKIYWIPIREKPVPEPTEGVLLLSLNSGRTHPIVLCCHAGESAWHDGLGVDQSAEELTARAMRSFPFARWALLPLPQTTDGKP